MKKTLLSLAFLAAGAASYAQITAGSMMIGGTLGFGSGSTKLENTLPAPAFNTTTEGTTSSFNIKPTFGYFLMDNLAIGVMFNYGMTSRVDKGTYDKSTGTPSMTISSPHAGPNTVTQDFKNETSTLGVALFANKYMEVSEKWMWFFGGNLHYNMTSGKATTIQQTALGVWGANEVDQPATTNIGVGANIGMLFWLNNNWALQADMNNLIAFDMNMTDQDRNNGFGGGTTKTTNSNMNLSLGLASQPLNAINLGLFYFLR